MSGFSKLVGIAVIAVIAAVASFEDDIAVVLGVTVLVIAGFAAVAILVGAAVATRHGRATTEKAHAPALDAAPTASPLQKR